MQHIRNHRRAWWLEGLGLPLKVLEGFPVVGIGLGKKMEEKQISWKEKEGNKSNQEHYSLSFFFFLGILFALASFFGWVFF